MHLYPVNNVGNNRAKHKLHLYPVNNVGNIRAKHNMYKNIQLGRRDRQADRQAFTYKLKLILAEEERRGSI